MIRQKIVAGNWKMNTGLPEALQLVSAIKNNAVGKSNDVLKIVIPPFPFIKPVAEILEQENDFFVGAQNCSEHEKGAYTGEVSAAMLQSVNCSYVLVGHSERRTYFKESTQQLVSKIQQALLNHLDVIFCFGEQLNERKNNVHFQTVEQQLRDVLSSFPKDRTANLVLAYEPVWAIGTGETATPAQAQEIHVHVRKVISSVFSESVANRMSILYGGSCNAQNAAELFSCADVDGGLIGGASLKADDFGKIIASFP